MEKWRTIREFPDYEVSDHGRVRRRTPDRRNHTPRVLTPWVGNHGYETVSLINGDTKEKRLIHRLVCEAFHGAPPDPNMHVAHGDGTRRNNHATNLRWATRSENMEDSRLHGTMALGVRHGRAVCPERTPRGEKHGHAKLTEAHVFAIRSVVSATGRQIADQFGVSPATVSLIRSRKIWSHI